MKKTKKKHTKTTTKSAGVTKKSATKKKTPKAKKLGRKKKMKPAVKKAQKKRLTKKKQPRQVTKKASQAKSKKKSSTVKSGKNKQMAKATAKRDEVVAIIKRGKVKDTVNQDLDLKNLLRKPKQTPAVFKLPSRKHTPIVFSLEEVRDVLKYRQTETETITKSKRKKSTPVKTKEAPKRKEEATLKRKTKSRKLGAASIADILGFNPTKKGAKPVNDRHDPNKLPKKFHKYYNMLLELRDHVRSGLNLHTQDTLKRSSKDDTGELSSYSQYIVDDASADNFDRDFALSLVSNEQEALSEIDAAINRIFDGTYGICEITGQQIKRERLVAVPFTRFSVQGQVEYESTNRKSVQRGGLFIDSNVENSAQFTNDDSEE